ncbi:MAG: hypothetical protein M3R24_30210 [Chloroflexota bacterium]|nr:hypothetical protein [Chloroflexota bacterium]
MSHNEGQASRLLLFSRLLGLGAAIATVLLYGMLVFVNPYNADGITTGTYIVSAVMSVFALLAAWGALRLKPVLLLLAFLGSFVPVGYYFWHTPGIFALIGFANLLYGVVAFIILAYQRIRTRQ